MAYQVLARKWRPSRFSELVGQEHVVSAISNALDNNRLHHAYLFTGTRGVGKTTIARIFSKSLNCDKGMSANPCGECHTCKEIENGSFVDLLEIDAASRTKVEDTRELLDNVQYKPTRGDFKVYLIDEVHMLSKHSFNALLKTLEEPPPHVKFLLATTDPQKLPVTILSRCLQFNLKALSREQISQQLTHVLTQEQITFEPSAIQQLSRAAQGSMRDALSLTDQAIAQGNGNVSAQVVTDMLGLMDKGQVLKLVHSVFNNDAQEVMALVEKLAAHAIDFENVLAEMMSLLHQVALTQFVPEACKLETGSARAIFQLSKMLPPEQVQLAYQIALQGKKDLPFAADARVGLEMTLLRMLAFNPSPLNLSSQETNDLAVEQVKSDHQDGSSAQTKQSIDALNVEQETLLKQAQALGAQIKSTEVDASESEAVESSKAIESDLIPDSEPETDKAEIKPVVPVEATSASFFEKPDYNEERFSEEMPQGESSLADFYAEENMAAVAQPSLPTPDNSIDLSHQAEMAKQMDHNTSSESLITSTQNLIALKNQLAQKEIASEVADTPVKKSELEFNPKQFAAKKLDSQTAPTSIPSLGENSTAAEFEDSLKNESSPEIQQVETVAEEKAFQESALYSSDVDDSATMENLSLDQPIADESEKVLTTTEPAKNEPELPVASQQQSSDTPPWSEESSNPITLESAPPPEQSELAEAFDPMAHLNEPIEVEVDFDVPAFLQSGEKVTAAQQLDTWSQLIEQMQVTALTKQLALHSAYEKNAQVVTLKLLDSKPHLDTESARNQLQQALSQLFNEDIELIVEHTQPINTPFAVQQTINQVRMQHARKVADNDENINRLKSTFAAHVVDDSIKPR
ncbi:DNA polymerase III subunit gamma/tau [Aliiglaciecola sp. M165]|uniref:DNA polymerase III subunit gamma/tau n=1 Tax=Aliiglaciecola sp. M165 TaxID=2593649 RepID=UPI0011805F49|nr:DNA polymerase III subunit gamma/tau [Aliiglaciecola sp. M165]TRY32652.1 DNA polymerase III subunit gamma/tau [Aliiglaciecola sp. M165]